MSVSEIQVREIVHEEVLPLELDMKSAKNWAISLLGTLILMMFSIGVWVGTIQNRVATVEENQLKFEVRVERSLERIENLLLQLTKEINN